MLVCFFFVMIRRPPRSTLTDTLFPYTTLFRSDRSSAMAVHPFLRFNAARLPRFIPLRGPLLGPLVIWRRIAAELAGEGQQGEVGHALRIEDAVEMVALVLHDASMEALGLAHQRHALQREAAVADASPARDLADQPRHRKAGLRA